MYRSRLLLDSDLAARSASLGRIFTDLGFQNRALVEGWNSLDTDPSNYSAHRLLADSYAALPRHEIARVSELFQSQMLQPLNTTPIQPSLGESNLFLISAQGPGALAFNEFNPLFNRDQVNAQGSFLVGEDDTLAGEGIVSGIYKKLSFSAGYSGFKTDGFRENNAQDDKIANVFLQAELSPSTSLQAEFRYRDLETGDLGLRFYENDFSPLQTEATNGTSIRFGLRQEFGPSVTLLASYMHADKDIDFALPEPDLLQSFASAARRRPTASRGSCCSARRRSRWWRGGLLRHRLRRDDQLRDRRPRLRVHRHHERRFEDPAHQPVRLRLRHAREEPDADAGRERRPLRGDRRVLLGLPDPRPPARPAGPDRAAAGPRARRTSSTRRPA